MNTYDPKKPLISIHIPKCAGSAFSNILKLWFTKGFRLHYHNEKQNKQPKKHNLYSGIFSKRLKRGLCIHGHFNNKRGNGVCDYYPEADQFITVIRDPFNLHLSNYFFVKRKGENSYRSGKRHPIIENAWNIKDYLKEAKKSYICQFLPSNITLENYQQVLEEQFLYIGITESLQNSVDLLAQKLGFSSMMVPVTNVSEWNESIPDGSREKFIENNPLEMAVYRYAKENFGNQFEKIKFKAHRDSIILPKNWTVV